MPGVIAQPQTTTIQQPTDADDSNSTVKSILSRDGKHTIPYDVLEAERAQKAADLLAKATASSSLPASPSDVGSKTQHTTSPLEQAAFCSLFTAVILFVLSIAK
ncbi:hypothetical protein [Pectobacterium jejuense]|uniref:hypothetical protein n=1 Tax=Pectobacterium jejuense TaxID=2974022 RepID=UPI002281A1DC|nr:hypothetical protein [Pectobacterium jejuense]MCY9847399.1 hypothetical protein [Pectobacterium jejuense]